MTQQQPARCVRCFAEATGIVLGPIVEGHPRYMVPTCEDCGGTIFEWIKRAVAADIARAKERRPQA